MQQLDLFSAPALDITEYLRQSFGAGDIDEMCEQTGLTERALRARALRLGLTREPRSSVVVPHQKVMSASAAPSLYRMGLVSSVFQIGGLQ